MKPPRFGELARHCHTSESTLLRAFRRDFETTPATYARERRLEASLLLLKSGRYTVTEVAARVGYGSLPAFTIAFRRRFGSSVLGEPHGAASASRDASAAVTPAPSGQKCGSHSASATPRRAVARLEPRTLQFAHA